MSERVQRLKESKETETGRAQQEEQMCENGGGGQRRGTVGNREGCTKRRRSEKHRQKEREGQK